MHPLRSAGIYCLISCVPDKEGTGHIVKAVVDSNIKIEKEKVMEILRFAVGVLTVLTGLVSLFWPLRIRGFTGLDVSGGRGITEIRTVLGGVFIANRRRRHVI